MTVAGVLLAAGAGARFDGDGHKLRAQIDGVTVLERSLGAICASVIDKVLLVVGDDDYRDIVESVANGHKTEIITVHSPHWAKGQAHSLGVAVAYARDNGWDSVVVGLADQPLVGKATWNALAQAPNGPIVVANYVGQRRPPVRLDASVWDRLPADGDEGARQLLIDEPENVFDVLSAGWPNDVDTADALDQVRQLHTDRARTTELIGREPMGSFDVVVRDDHGQPVVLKNFPVLADGRPMPTLYWLCGERESMLIGRLEALKGVRRAEAAVGLDAVNATHERYRAERDAILEQSSVQPPHRPTGGVGGTRNGVKCLHAHYGYWLAGGDDPVGQWVHDHLHEVDSPSWPAPD